MTFSDIEYSSWLNPMKFLNVTIEAGYRDMSHVRFIHDYLVNGTRISCEGEGRLPTHGTNDPTVSDYGYEISDEIQEWINMGICVGHYPEKNSLSLISQ